MKWLILSLLLTLTACSPGFMDGYGNVNQPIVLPDTTFHRPVTKVFTPMVGNSRSCYIDILLTKDSYLYASQYSIDCTYHDNNTVKEFYITFYNTLPVPATLRYSLY